MQLHALRSRLTALAVLIVTGLSPTASMAQNPFETVIRVNDTVITRYELDQRVLFLTLLNAGANPEEIARQQLVNEALQLNASDLEGIVVPEAAVAQSQTAFASQGQMDRDQFIGALAEQGVEEGTFRNLILSGLAWREAVRTRFGPQVRVTPEDIDRALARVPAEGGTRVLVNEIVLPAGNPETQAASLARANEIRQITDFTEFQNAARLFSISGTRFLGGEVDWRAVSELPPELSGDLRSLAPGQVTRPATLEGVILLLQIRDREEVLAGSVDAVSADYVEYLIPGGRTAENLARANEVASEIRTCDDFFGVMQGQDASRLSRQIVRLNALPSDVSREIALLDENEISTNLTRGGNLVVLMLCQRTVRESAAVDRQRAEQALVGQRLETFAAGYLNELRLAAEIEVLQ